MFTSISLITHTFFVLVAIQTGNWKIPGRSKEIPRSELSGMHAGQKYIVLNDLTQRASLAKRRF